jgi:hypothetical protein
MPTPKKEKLSNAELRQEQRQLAQQYDITFDGPVPPERWPVRYRHLFNVVRDIGSNRFDEYKQNSDISREIREQQEERVKRLCIHAKRLRNDLNINESTWRDQIEKPVIERFSQNVVWLVPHTFILIYSMLICHKFQV